MSEQKTTLAEGLRAAVGVMGKATRKPECALRVLALFVWRWLATPAAAPLLWSLEESGVRLGDLETYWARVENARASEPATLGERLNALAKAMDAGAPSWKGLFTGVDFEASDCPPDPHARDQLLARIIAILDATHDETDPRAAGDAFAAIVQRLAGRDKGRLGLHDTPPALARLVAGLAELGPGLSILDPHCGTGALLVAAWDGAESASMPAHDRRLIGQEGHPTAQWIARLNLLLHGLDPAPIIQPKTPTERATPDLSHGFDRVLTAVSASAMEVAETGVPLPARWGTTTPRRGEWAQLHQALERLAPNGLGVILVPRGLLFREGVERMLRERLVAEHGLEAVIGLPTVPAGAAQAILVCRPWRRPERGHRVLFIEPEPTADLETEGARIVDTYRAWREEAGFSRLLERAEITGEAHRACLDPARYVRRRPADEGLDIARWRAVIREAEQRRDREAKRMDRLLDELLR